MVTGTLEVSSGQPCQAARWSCRGSGHADATTEEMARKATDGVPPHDVDVVEGEDVSGAPSTRPAPSSPITAGFHCARRVLAACASRRRCRCPRHRRSFHSSSTLCEKNSPLLLLVALRATTGTTTTTGATTATTESWSVSIFLSSVVLRDNGGPSRRAKGGLMGRGGVIGSTRDHITPQRSPPDEWRASAPLAVEVPGGGEVVRGEKWLGSNSTNPQPHLSPQTTPRQAETGACSFSRDTHHHEHPQPLFL